MSTIGKNRLSIYNLLYENPMCNYIFENELNVLIIGTGWVGSEAFKAAFWAGQYPDTKLNITIASENAEKYKNAIKCCLPGITDFADFDDEKTSKYHYANIYVKHVSFTHICNSGIDDESAVVLNLSKQNYIIVSVGDEDINTLISELISDSIESSERKTLIASYGTNDKQEKGCIDLVGFSSKLPDNTDLMKLGSSIYYMYASKYNSRANRKQKSEEFEKHFMHEFIETPEDADDVFVSLKNFTGKDYDADSSLAQAVHIPYKLWYCCQERNEKKQLIELVKIINEKKTVFNRLVALEHRRWNAFMAIRGYRMPEKNELGYLYTNGCTHKDNNRLLHICMCECDEKGAKLGRYSAIWKSHNDTGLCDLDRMSLLCHKDLINKTGGLKTQLSADLNCLNNYELSEPNKAALIIEFKEAIIKLLNDDDGAEALYELIHKKIKENITNENLCEVIDIIDKKLKLAKLKNQKIDFLSYDAQFISMIPICLKLKEETSTVITFTNSKNVNDVIVPWLLCADRAVFVYPSGTDILSRQLNICKFFDNHGGNTKAEFLKLSGMYIETIKENLRLLLKNYENMIFNITSNLSPELLLALGEYSSEVPLITYDINNGLSFYNSEKILPSKVEDSVLYVNDYIELLDGEITNKYTTLVPYNKCEKLADFFWRTNLVKTRDGTKKKAYNEWNSVLINSFLQKREVCIDEYGCTIYTLPLSAKREEEQMERSFIKLLEKEKIIHKAEYSGDAVRFNPADTEFYTFLTEKGGNLFEALVYYKLLRTCMFGDAQTGVSFKWKTGTSEYVLNEIDVVATNGINLLLVSCKTNPIIDNGFIYEISSEAASFGAIAILAVSQDLSNPNNCNHNAVARAAATNVSVLDAHILKDEKLLKKAIAQILQGKYKGPENFQ